MEGETGEREKERERERESKNVILYPPILATV